MVEQVPLLITENLKEKTIHFILIITTRNATEYIELLMEGKKKKEKLRERTSMNWTASSMWRHLTIREHSFAMTLKAEGSRWVDKEMPRVRVWTLFKVSITLRTFLLRIPTRTIFANSSGFTSELCRTVSRSLRELFRGEEKDEEGEGGSFGREDIWGLMTWRCCGVDDDDGCECGFGGGVTMEEPRITKSLILGQPFVSLNEGKEKEVYVIWVLDWNFLVWTILSLGTLSHLQQVGLMCEKKNITFS